jgi:hypothetical protein
MPHLPAQVVSRLSETPARTGITRFRNGQMLGLLLIVLVLIPVSFVTALLTSANSSFTALDGSFTMKNPGGWSPSTAPFVGGYRIVLAIDSNKGGDKSALVVMDVGQQIAMEDIPAAWEQLPVTARIVQFTQLGSLTPSTVAGAPALAGETDVVKDGVGYSGEFIFINYNNTTWIVAFGSTDYPQMQHDFQAMLASRKWLH